MSGCCPRDRFGSGNCPPKAANTAASKALDADLKALLAKRGELDSALCPGGVCALPAAAKKPAPGGGAGGKK
jgi:hypothetical protein